MSSQHGGRAIRLLHSRRSWLAVNSVLRHLATSPLCKHGALEPAADKHTKVRVRREEFIPTSTEEIHLALEHSIQFGNGRWHGIRKVLSALDIIYGAEYQESGRQLRRAIRAINTCVVVPEGASVTKGELGEPPDAVYATPETSRQLQSEFLSCYKRLTEKSHFRRVTPRDSAMAEVLNADYLSQIFIKPSPEETDGCLVRGLVDPDIEHDMQSVAIFNRGWGVQHREGRLLGQKIDFMQQVVARNSIRRVRRSVQAVKDAASQLRQKVEEQIRPSISSLQDDLRIQFRKLIPPWPFPLRSRPATEPPPPASSSPDVAQRQSSSTWRLAHLVAPPDSEERLRDFEQRWPVNEPQRLSPLYISRVTVGDALGGDKLGAIQEKGWLSLLQKLKLMDPTFAEVMVLFRNRPKVNHLYLWERRLRHWEYQLLHTKWRLIKRVRKRLPELLRRFLPPPGAPPAALVEPPYLMEPVSIRVYKDVPVPIWRVCFPFPKVAFKPLDLLYMDLMAVAGVLAILAQVMYGNQRGVLQLVWVSSLVAQAIRVFLGYTRMYSYFEGYVHRTLHQKMVVSEDGAGQMLAAAAGLQQYKQSAILYALLAAKARPRPFSAIVTTDVVSLTPEQLSAEAEALLERCGEKVHFDVAEPLEELSRLGIVKVLHQFRPESGIMRRQIRIQVLAPQAALQVLEQHWAGLMDRHVKAAPSTYSGDDSIWGYSFWENNVTGHCPPAPIGS